MFGLIAFALVFISAVCGSWLLYFVAWVLAFIGAAHEPDGYRNDEKSDETERKSKYSRLNWIFGNVSIRFLLISWIALVAKTM